MPGFGADPGLPGPKPSAAYWQSVPSPIATHQSPSLPRSASVVVIGSGITGASVVRHLLQEQPDLDIVMLEARSVTSGATGRNGGHCKDVSFKTYRLWKAAFGTEAARRLVKFRGGHLDSTRALARQLQQEGVVDAQFRDVESVTAVFDPVVYQEYKANLDEWFLDNPEDRGKLVAVDGAEAHRKYGIIGSCGVISSPAGALWPYRLITGLLEKLLRTVSNFSLETYTPVTSIASGPHRSRPYRIHTARGTIDAQHVIHCTNGHAAHLLPKLQNKIVPVRGQMTALEPSEDLPRVGHERSWSLIWPNGGFDYMTQAPGKEGLVFLGGGVEQAAEQRVIDFGSVSDDEMNKPALDHLCSVLPNFFEGGKGTTLKQAWTGVMGFTPDSFPVVGMLPGNIGSIDAPPRDKSSGEWIAAGFNGYGMVHCWHSGRALAQMITGKGQQPLGEWFPVEQFACTNERLENMSYDDLKTTFYKNAPKTKESRL